MAGCSAGRFSHPAILRTLLARMRRATATDWNADYDDSFTADLMWDGAPDGFPDALRTVTSITRRCTETADKTRQPPADIVAWAHQALLNPTNTFTARLCAEQPDTCQGRDSLETS